MIGDLLDRIDIAAERGQHVTFLDGDAPEEVSWAELRDDAVRVAIVLQQRGLGPGDRMALVGATSRQLFTALEACWLAGAALIVPPLRTRLEAEEEFRLRTVERLRLGDVSVVACDEEHLEVARVSGLPDPASLSALMTEARAVSTQAYERPPVDAEQPVILQFTSGSTAEPKGVVIPERCLLDNLDAVVDRAPLDVGADVMVSWLPLYHDMGLVYNAALAITTGVRFVLAPPARFIAAPSSWMEWMHEFGGTWTIAPNFALSLSGRVLRKSTTLDLSRCARLGSGSEPVDPDTMEAFIEAASHHSLDAGALYAGYGMAEATVAVSFDVPGSGFQVDEVDAAALEFEGVAESPRAGEGAARRLARCGPPLRGMELRIVDPDTGKPVTDRVAGEIELRGPSIVPGYFRRPDATAAAFRPDGWLRTGDLGYVAEGDLVVCGRLKDVIIVGGRNVFPEDLERPVQHVQGVRPGNVIAFGIAGGRKGDSIVVVAEVKGGDPDAVRDGIARAVRESVGLRLDDIVLLAPGGLPKTSSGKLRRSACRAQYQAAELERL